MQYEICELLANNFIVDPKDGAVFLAKRIKKSNGEVKIDVKAEVEDNFQKAFIYAYFYFWDAVKREISKLIKRIDEITVAVKNDASIDTKDIAKLYAAVSARTRRVLGNSNLDALIKEHFGKNERSIVLIPEEEEERAYAAVKEAIFNEVVREFANGTLGAATDEPTEEFPDRKTFMVSAKYLLRMTPLQQKLIKATLKIVALEEGVRLDRVEITPTWQVYYIPRGIGEGFDGFEEGMTSEIRELIENDGVSKDEAE
ncbi:MAG: hypothetical protein LBM01_03620 [Christensenellaceae bacterium]|jgi:hypothetical protein|nr:hypothetical protein [Christensenellaceae bacterium]